MNTRYGKNVVAQVFAPNTANGLEKYNTAPDTWGHDAVSNRHLRLDGTSSAAWMNLHAYNYQKYTTRTNNNAGLTGYADDYNSLRALIAPDMPGEPQLPMVLTEFNVRTASQYSTLNGTSQDTPSDYSALGANCVALTKCGVSRLYLFKFGQTTSTSLGGAVTKNGTHYVQNDGGFNYGGASQAAEVYRLFIKASGSSRKIQSTTATANALPTTTAGLWSLVTYSPEKGSYYVFLSNKNAAVSLSINVAALGLPTGAPVFVEEVSGTGQKPTLGSANVARVTLTGTAGLPIQAVDGTGRPALTYIRRKATTSPGASYHVEFSTNLNTWAENADATESSVALDPTFERVTLTDSAPVANWGRRFIRLRVTVP